MTMSLEDHLEEYMEQGYTIFRDYLPKETIAALRAQAEPYFEGLIAKKQPGKGGFWQAAKVGGRGRVALAPAIGPELAERGMLPALEGLLELSHHLEHQRAVLQHHPRAAGHPLLAQLARALLLPLAHRDGAELALPLARELQSIAVERHRRRPASVDGGEQVHKVLGHSPLIRL